VIHCAASLNRKSEKSCLNVNLRGALEVVQLARRCHHYHGLRRFSQVSTVAVCGKRSNEVVTEGKSIDWERSDYDPYARTKKFNEHMIRQLLPEVPLTFFRPSIVLGDSRRAETTQFDMVRSFVFLAGLPMLPFRATDKIDIVNVDFVADAIATLHQNGFADVQRIDGCAGGGPTKARSGISADAGETVQRNGEYVGEPTRRHGPWSGPAESLYAVSHLEYRV
jgi:nucleoside-diphosphate-sugar epimerase